MSATKIRDLIHKVLKSDDRIWSKTSSSDKTLELNYTLLLKFIEDIDEKIIDTLIKEKKLKEKFFVKTKSAYVFKSNDFRFFMEENKVDNSYTQYKNKIGLTDGKRFLQDTNDVVLDFPYKDCVLEGGQSTEEGMDTSFKYSEKTKKYETEKSKRKEIFFNQTIASDEIDRLFDEKALVNWKRYTKNGEETGDETIKEIKRDDDGTIKENLIIKGNNLLALHSLKKQFAGKVKLIYIDPPYNTGKDGFKYNDKFEHSTWLTFMKNRLEVARELLRDDGIISVQCDDNEHAYLKVLMDDIFDRDNFMAIIAWQGMDTIKNDAKFFSTNCEFIGIFAKDKEQVKISGLEKTEKQRGYYKNRDKDPRGDYLLTPLHAKSGNEKNKFEYTFSNGQKYTPPKGRFWSFSRESLNKLDKENRLFLDPKNKNVPQKKTYLSEVGNYMRPTTFWDYKRFGSTRQANKELREVLSRGLFSSPKPESLIKSIIELSTKAKDIILDFHLGSGTTAAVAHKMGRQYIGIEQMEYIESIACKRLKKVLNGEQGGVSKSVNWQGGGDFIYLELAKWNEQAKEQIEDCNSLEELKKFFMTLYKKYFLNYNVNIKNFQEKIMQEENFKKLSLEKHKEMFLEMLDLNQMYVQKTEMGDKKFGISKEYQGLTNKFYNEKR